MTGGETFENTYFTQYKIYKNLCQLKCKLSAGPYGYPPIFFKKLVTQLSAPISTIYVEYSLIEEFFQAVEERTGHTNF